MAKNREWDVYKERETPLYYFEKISNFTTDIERNQELNRLLNERGNLFEDHLSSEQFVKKMKPNKSGFLSEEIPICVTLEKLANTLLFASEKTGKNDDKYYPIQKDITKERRYKKEESYCEGTENNKDESGNGDTDSALKAKKLPRSWDSEHGVNFNVEIKSDDLKWTTQDEESFHSTNCINASDTKFPYFVYYTLTKKQKMETRKTTEAKMKKNIIDLNEILKELRKLPTSKSMISWRSGITQNMVSTKEAMKYYIRFKKMSNESVYVDLDRNTWYESNGEYAVVSENAIRLSNPRHVYGVLKSYRQIKESNDAKFDSELMSLFLVIDDLVASSDLTEQELFMVKLLKDDQSQKTIQWKVKEKFDVEIPKVKLHRILRKYIPNKIVETYKKSREDWMYEFKIRGRFKTCSSCDTPKPATPRNYGMNMQKEDGIKDICRDCEKKIKNKNKNKK